MQGMAFSIAALGCRRPAALDFLMGQAQRSAAVLGQSAFY
jgi:hypothetical protein